MEKEKVHNFGGRFLYFCVKVEKEFRVQNYDFFLIYDFWQAAEKAANDGGVKSER